MRNCIFHDWDKWGSIKTDVEGDDYQERECKNCGALDQRSLYFNRQRESDGKPIEDQPTQELGAIEKNPPLRTR